LKENGFAFSFFAISGLMMQLARRKDAVESRPPRRAGHPDFRHIRMISLGLKENGFVFSFFVFSSHCHPERILISQGHSPGDANPYKAHL
jgi:hypothetical protein